MELDFLIESNKYIINELSKITSEVLSTFNTIQFQNSVMVALDESRYKLHKSDLNYDDQKTQELKFKYLYSKINSQSEKFPHNENRRLEAKLNFFFDEENLDPYFDHELLDTKLQNCRNPLFLEQRLIGSMPQKPKQLEKDLSILNASRFTNPYIAPIDTNLVTKIELKSEFLNCEIFEARDSEKDNRLRELEKNCNGRLNISQFSTSGFYGLANGPGCGNNDYRKEHTYELIRIPNGIKNNVYKQCQLLVSERFDGNKKSLACTKIFRQEKSENAKKNMVEFGNTRKLTCEKLLDKHPYKKYNDYVFLIQKKINTLSLYSVCNDENVADITIPKNQQNVKLGCILPCDSRFNYSANEILVCTVHHMGSQNGLGVSKIHESAIINQSSGGLPYHHQVSSPMNHHQNHHSGNSLTKLAVWAVQDGSLLNLINLNYEIESCGYLYTKNQPKNLGSLEKSKMNFLQKSHFPKNSNGDATPNQQQQISQVTIYLFTKDKHILLASLNHKDIIKKIDISKNILSFQNQFNSMHLTHGANSNTKLKVYSLFQEIVKGQNILTYEQFSYGSYLLQENLDNKTYYLYNVSDDTVVKYQIDKDQTVKNNHIADESLEESKVFNFQKKLEDPFDKLDQNTDEKDNLVYDKKSFSFLVLKGVHTTSFVIYDSLVGFKEICLKKVGVRNNRAGVKDLDSVGENCYEASFVKNFFPFGKIDLLGIKSILVEDSGKQYDFLYEDKSSNDKMYYCQFSIS